jgi:hypothetical protein
MTKRIFIEGKDYNTRAYFGWQDNYTALWGLKEGYKNSADNLVDIALKKGVKGDISVLDTYIFPILYLYRHSIEISLKLIYYRFYGELPKGQHDLVILWDCVKEKVIDVFNSEEFILNVKQYKKKFIKYSTDDIDFQELRMLICELQGVDNKADVWRYLMDKKGKLYFTESEFVDYKNMKSVIGDVFEQLDFFLSYCI